MMGETLEYLESDMQNLDPDMYAEATGSNPWQEFIKSIDTPDNRHHPSHEDYCLEIIHHLATAVVKIRSVLAENGDYILALEQSYLRLEESVSWFYKYYESIYENDGENDYDG